MKILISANTSWYIWNFRLTLMQAILAKGHTVTVVAPEDAYSSRFAAEGIAFVPVSINAKSVNPFGEIKTLLSYFGIYLAQKPDLVLQYTVKPNLYGSICARFLGIPAIDNVSGLGAAFEKKGLLSFIVKTLYRFAFKKVHTVFFQNQDDRSLFVGTGLIRPEIAGLLPGSGVNISRFVPTKKQKGPFTFLFVGRLLRAKGVEQFVRAARIFRDEVAEPVRFVLLGTHDSGDPHMADAVLLEAAIADGTVTHQGQVDDVRIWLDQADCVVIPSWYREGVPRSLLEAAACGKPLIAADSVGTREPVTDGINGFLCEPKSDRDLADKMLAVFGLNPAERDKMGRNSRKIAETRFNEQIVLDSYLEILDGFALQ